MITKLHIDIETYSPESIASCGLYKYSESPEFKILLFAYKWDGEATKIVDLACGEGLPQAITDALTDPGVIKCAHNAAFERVCLTRYLRRRGLLKPDEWLDPAQWDCSMIQCARLGLPLSLKDAGKELGLEQQKMEEGKNLIKLFCTPKASKTGRMFGAQKRVMPEDYPEEWATFKRYCIRDVDVEVSIADRLSWYEVTPTERRIYALDQRINDRGVLTDDKLVSEAMKADALRRAELGELAQRITGLGNPNSPAQLRMWLSEELGEPVSSLTKNDLADLRAKTEPGTPARQIVDIRAELGKTSVKKYEAISECAGQDNRVRGLFQFHGSRTGRWAGRLVQMQNLPQNHIAGLDFARNALKQGDTDTLALCYGNLSDTLSQLIRTAFVAPRDYTFAVCDFSAIEARVLAWMAGEDWVLDVFRNGGDIYCATASQMFHVPVEKHGQNAELRQKGKIAVLALGYGGGTAALEAMGGSRLGLTPEEESDIVAKWRGANKKIVSFWKGAERAALGALETGVPIPYSKFLFASTHGNLTVTLPSGRVIVYPGMRIGAKGRLEYRGQDQKTGKYGWVDTYGGKMTENLTQAVARDCLVEIMLRVDRGTTAPPRIVAHVHDEIIAEVPEACATESLERIKEAFAEPISWASKLPLKGAGYITPYYLKD